MLANYTSGPCEHAAPLWAHISPLAQCTAHMRMLPHTLSTTEHHPKPHAAQAQCASARRPALGSALHKLLLQTHVAWAHLRIMLMRACLFDFG